MALRAALAHTVTGRYPLLARARTPVTPTQARTGTRRPGNGVNLFAIVGLAGFKS